MNVENNMIIIMNQLEGRGYCFMYNHDTEDFIYYTLYANGEQLFKRYDTILHAYNFLSGFLRAIKIERGEY